MGVVDEHSVFWLKNLPDEKLEPLLGQPTHVQSRLSQEGYFQLFLQVFLFGRYLLHGVGHQVISSDSDVEKEQLDVGHLMPHHVLHH